MRETLIDHLNELFQSGEYDNIYVENQKAHFMVCEADPLKVNDEECTCDELYALLDHTGRSCTSCDGIKFQRVGSEYLASGEICRVEVFLDDNVPEYMAGIIRIGSVISYDEADERIGDHQELADNAEFYDENQLIQYVAERLEVDGDIIEIVD